MDTLTIENLIERKKVTMISYLDEEGFPYIKAMLAPRKREGIKTFYFTTNTSSTKVKYFKENSKASIYYVDENTFEGVTFIGTMKILTDEKSKESIWRQGDTLYYPKGVTDPDYCVLAFTAEKAYYYHNLKETKIVL